MNDSKAVSIENAAARPPTNLQEHHSPVTRPEMEAPLLSQDKWLQEFLRHARVKDLFKTGDKVLVAVSGGLDSSVLAHLVTRAARLLKMHVEFVHVDHRTRGLSSEREGSWVKVLGDRLGVKTHLLSLPETPGVKASHAELRIRRRSLLVELADEFGLNKITTAHHADDNAETFLMRAISGTGVTGLAGMKAIDAPWVKPLLWATKKDLEDYARRFRLGWVEDPSNVKALYLRNRLRHEALPLLDSIRQGALANLARAAARIDQEECEWEEWLKPQFEGPVEILPRSFLEKYPEALQRRIFRLWLGRLGLESEPALVEALVEGQEIVHKEGCFLRRSDMYLFYREQEFGKDWAQPVAIELAKRISLGRSTAWSFLRPSDFVLKECLFYVFFLFRPPNELKSNQHLWMAWDKIPWPLMIRARESTDSVKELDEHLAKHRIPRPFWKSWPLVVSQEDPSKIIALVGVAVLRAYRLEELGRCVSMESFFEDDLRRNSST